MYMRGWKLKKETYPLTVEESNFPDDAMVNIENNVIPALLKLKEIAEDPEISEGIKKIRMVQYTSECRQWTAPTSASFGLYLLDKLNIILQNQTEASCIRWSSNFIVGGAYFYLDMMGYSPKFSISDLQTIL